MTGLLGKSGRHGSVCAPSSRERVRCICPDPAFTLTIGLWAAGPSSPRLYPRPRDPTSEEEGPMRTWTGMAALLAFTFWLGSCATNPATGEKQISFVSQSQEIQMGAD